MFYMLSSMKRAEGNGEDDEADDDDDEFVLLNDYHAILLKMLYDPRLTSGLSLEDTEPIRSQIITDLNRPET